MRPAVAGSRRVSGVLLCAALAVATLTAASCSNTDEAKSPAPSGDPTAASNPQDLAALKRQAGIEPCPRSSPKVETIDGGLPDVTLSCLGGGREVDLAGLRGRPTVVNLWAQWCGPCRSEVPLFQRLHEQAGARVPVIGIDFDDPQAGGAIAFAGNLGMTYPQLADPDTLIKESVGVPGLPVTLFVAADGTIAGRQIGPVDSYDQLTQLVSDDLGVTL
jgi:cytochrome c biogenesis protein CcmG, thiol:disulfide interchange protein DsbE